MTAQRFNGAERSITNLIGQISPVPRTMTFVCIPESDEEYRALADKIEQKRPGWMVIWGIFSRRFTAYPLFPIRRRVIVVAYYPDALIERMDSAERLLRIQAANQEGAQQ